jgi:hypothetical protein
MIQPYEQNGKLYLPDGRVIAPRMQTGSDGIQRIAGLMTASEWWQLQNILRSQYFLFRNDGGQYGERMICRKQNPDGSWRGCGLKHMYITYMCVEMPFRGGDGLEEGLFISFRASTDEVRQHQILKAISKLPDLASGHPFTAHDLEPDDPGENWLSVLLSLPEPITREQAEHFTQKINDKNPPMKFDIGPP